MYQAQDHPIPLDEALLDQLDRKIVVPRCFQHVQQGLYPTFTTLHATAPHIQASSWFGKREIS